MIPPYQLWDHPADPVTEGPAQWLSPSLPAPKGLSVSGGTGHNSCIICFDLPPKVCAPTSSIQIVISLAQQLIIDRPTSPSPSTFPPSTFRRIFMYHMYIPYLPKSILRERCIVRRVVSGKTVSWGLKLLRYPLCLQGSDTEQKGDPVKCT